MSGKVSSKLPSYFKERLLKRNWTAEASYVDFIIGDYAVLRITAADFRENVSLSLIEKKIEKFVSLPLRRIVVIEGRTDSLLTSRSKLSFSVKLSIKKYLKFSELIRILVVKYGVTVIQTYGRTMTLEFIYDLEQQVSEDDFVDFFMFGSEYPKVADKKFYNIVTYLSAHYGVPFQRLSKEQIVSGLKEVKIPGVGERTIDLIVNRLYNL